MKRILQVLIIIAIVLASPLFWTQTARSSPVLQATGTPFDGIFLPFLHRGGVFTITGQALDSTRKPLAGVMISDQKGNRVVTDQDGRYAFAGLPAGDYALAAQREGYLFEQTVRNITLKSGDTQQDFIAAATNAELIVNGSFESNDTWIFPGTEYPAKFTTAASHTGIRAARTGIEAAADNTYSYSSVRQLVTIPANAESAVLRVWLYPWTGETATSSLRSELELGVAAPDLADFGTATASNDAQYVLVLDPRGPGEADDTLVETLLWTRSNDRVWALHQFDLQKYTGQTIKIQIGTYNDGWNGVSGMYVDDVSLETTDTGGTPTPAPTPTTSPPAAGCTTPLVNSGFEIASGWNIPITEYPAGYTTSAAHSGTGSMRTGILNNNQNTFSYSDAYQVVTIPSTATSANLKFWFLTQSNETVKSVEGENLEILDRALAPGMAWGEAAPAADSQYVLILDPNSLVILKSFSLPNDTNAWHNRNFDLLNSGLLDEYKGKTIRIQFGTFNDGGGGISAMYMDDMVLDICSTGGTPPPVTPTPTPTTVPGTCSERVANNGFESISAWDIPLTRFTAGYSSEQVHSGAQSMRTGIVFAAHNRFSYSDAGQLVSIPANTSAAQLVLWAYPITGEPESDLITAEPTGGKFAVAALGNDVQYVLVLDRFGNWIDTLLWQRSNSQTWTQHVFDLSRYAGQTIKIQFGVYNDGLNGITTLYVDDVTLQACP